MKTIYKSEHLFWIRFILLLNCNFVPQIFDIFELTDLQMFWFVTFIEKI